MKEAAKRGFDAREVLGPDVTFIRKGPKKGLFRVSLADGSNLITHGPDPKDEVEGHGTVIGPGDPELKPFCAAGNDHHFRILYGRPSSVPNTYGTAKLQIRHAIGRMTAVLNEEAIASGGSGARFKVHCNAAGTATQVESFVNDGSNQSCQGGGIGSFECVVTEARQAGFTAANYPRANFLIFYDSQHPAAPDVCGIGEFVADERLAADNINRFGEFYAASYGGPSIPANAVDCWDHRNPLHETAHTLGAVQYHAPRSSGDGSHCWDGTLLDVMCYDDGGNLIPSTGTTEPCSGKVYFDCQYNTYFDARPEAGEWLSKHWNLGSCLNRFVKFTGVTMCPNPAPKPLADGVWKADIHGGLGSWNYYTFQVPASSTSLIVTLDGPVQTCFPTDCYPDYDLYGRRGAKPTSFGDPCKSASTPADEKCTVQNPGAGKWYLGVYNYNPPYDNNNTYRIKADHRP